MTLHCPCECGPWGASRQHSAWSWEPWRSVGNLHNTIYGVINCSLRVGGKILNLRPDLCGVHISPQTHAGAPNADICVKLRDKSCSLQLGSCFCELSYLFYWGSEYTVNKQTKTCHTNLFNQITSDFKVLHFGFLSMLMSYKKVKSTTSDTCTLNQSAAV